ncbi:2,4-dihydroxyhept-2-ene-1,7-dioic acid aldolase [Rhodobacterales bacterium HKCCE3408]|nr:2,4-dihydroxyhept-2-ene-1,7-dioic acid aldolase [Rhodobacterales bacterium HKCCE3408]
MQRNRLRELWEADKPALNGWCAIASPFATELMARGGFDSLTVDIQHGALDYSSALPMIQAMAGSPVVPLARVPWLDAGYIMKALDAGVLGVICPMINNRAEAEEFVSYMRYPPLGQRSYGPIRAAVSMPGYTTDRANAEVLAFAMIETKSGVENLEDIAATPGLDGLYVGPSDLTLGTQEGRLPPGFDREEPEMTEIIRRIADVCAKNGLVAGIHCGGPEYAAKAISWGYRLTTVSGDNRYISEGAMATVADWKKANGL